MTDAVLFNKWRSERDAEAFRELASRYSGMVYATCLRVLRNPQEAEEAAQECFEKLAGAPRIASPYLGPWLHKVATNGAVDRLRHEGRRRTREDRYALERGTDHTPEWDDIYPLVDEAIAELPEELRVPLVSHFIENRTHESIAQELGVPRPTVTYRIQRALERVRQALKRRGVEVASAAFAAIIGEKMAQAAVVPAVLEAALGRLAVAGLHASPVAAGGASVLLGGVVTKVLLGAAALAIAAGFGWHTFAPKQPSQLPSRHAEASKLVITPKPLPASKATATTPNTEPLPEAAPKAAAEGGVITGRVYDAKTGRGVVGVTIQAECGTLDVSQEAASGADGAYRLTGLFDGTYSVRPVGFFTGYCAHGSQSVEATVNPQRPAEGVDFALNPGIPVTGRVVATDGTPVSQAFVRARLDSASKEAIAETRTDGTFQADMPEPGTGLRVQAESKGFRSLVVRRDALEQAGIGGIELVLTEPLTASVEGTLLLSNGSPASDYSLDLKNGLSDDIMAMFIRNTQADGTFKFDKLAAGTYAVVCGGPEQNGFLESTNVGEVTVKAGQALTGVVLRLDSSKQGLSITGQVVDTAGKAVARIGVRAACGGLTMTAGDIANTVTDERGEFTLSGLKEGTFSVHTETIRQPNGKERPYSPAFVQNVEAGTQGLKIVVEDVGRIEGRVVNARDGKPVPRFETYLREGNNAEFSPQLLGNIQNVNNAEGRFTRENVATGPQTIIVKAQGYPPALKVVEVKENQTASGLEFRLEPAAPLTGKVVDEDGKPVAGASIVADNHGRPAQTESPLARTGADGTFSLDLLSSQISHVFALHPAYPPSKASIDQLDNIVLQAGGAAAGRVTLDGQPLKGCEIRAMPPAGGYDAVLSRPDGSYRLAPLAAGKVTVHASRKGEQTCTQQVTIEPGGTSPLDFAFTTADSTVEGNVTQSGRPVANAMMHLIVETDAGEDSRIVQTDAAGHYLFANASSGMASVTFLETGGNQQNGADARRSSIRRANFEIEPGATAQHDFEIAAAGTIAGTVAGISNEWNATVILVPPGMAIPSNLDHDALLALMQHHALGIAGCGANGTYEIAQVPPGDYTVLAILLPLANRESFAEARMDSATVHVGDGPATVNLAPR